MSYDINLVMADGTLATVTTHAEGGTFVLGGVDEASLNVTYNYAELFGFRALDGQRASATIPEIQEAVDLLGTDTSDDYWDPTPGNVGHALSVLLGWAKQHPNATWRLED